MKVQVQMSVGELLDRVSIMEIKRTKTGQRPELYDEYSATAKSVLDKFPELVQVLDSLSQINMLLWTLEDMVRRSSGDSFEYYARTISSTNDLRARLKNRADELTNSVPDTKVYR